MPETSNPGACPNFSSDWSPSDLEGRVVVGMGGNVGDVRRRFGEVIEHFAEAGQPPEVSSLYRSAPIGPAQPDFLNAAFSIESAAWRMENSLIPLLRCLQSLETAAHRVRELRWGPRTLDLDILWAEGHRESSPELTIPHPHLLERRFALLPLLDLVPEARLPAASAKFSSALNGIPGQCVEKLAEGRWW